jgi:deoxyribonuclease V
LLPPPRWPQPIEDLIAAQNQLAQRQPGSWAPPDDPLVAGCFVCFSSADDRAFAAAATPRETATATGVPRGTYRPGLLALRAGPLLEQAVRGLPTRPDVVIADATGRDHPRRAGLALHLGAQLELPTVGVTHRALLATGDWPAEARGATSPLTIDGEVVGAWLRVQPCARPIAVHAAWRTDPQTAVEIVLRVARTVRTP